MLFSSNTFLFGFLPITVLAYYLSPRKFRNLLLLLASLVFYGWGEPRFLPLMLVSILLNYGCGRAVAARQAAGKDPKAALWAGVAVNLAMLGFFKYGRFFFGDRFPDIPLPIGISFYIFQAMSYVIDVSREQVPVQKNVLTFGTYVALFPQLIAGPIVRYRDVARELEDRRESGAQFAAGVLRFTLGLSKKVLLANTFGSAWNALREGAGMTSGWIGLMCYTLQIYFDFSGYSDMAIGLGLLFGFTFLENFNYPYISQSVTEFWRRWHISLSSWFREYVYIPLGGNRRGKKTADPQYSDCLAADRFMAWSQLEFCPLGRLLCAAPDSRKAVAIEDGRALPESAALPGNHAGGDAGLGNFLLRGPGTTGCLFGEAGHSGQQYRMVVLPAGIGSWSTVRNTYCKGDGAEAS